MRKKNYCKRSRQLISDHTQAKREKPQENWSRPIQSIGQVRGPQKKPQKNLSETEKENKKQRMPEFLPLDRNDDSYPTEVEKEARPCFPVFFFFWLTPKVHSGRGLKKGLFVLLLCLALCPTVNNSTALDPKSGTGSFSQLAL